MKDFSGFIDHYTEPAAQQCGAGSQKLSAIRSLLLHSPGFADPTRCRTVSLVLSGTLQRKRCDASSPQRIFLTNSTKKPTFHHFRKKRIPVEPNFCSCSFESIKSAHNIIVSEANGFALLMARSEPSQEMINSTSKRSVSQDSGSAVGP